VRGECWGGRERREAEEEYICILYKDKAEMSTYGDVSSLSGEVSSRVQQAGEAGCCPLAVGNIVLLL